MKVNRQLVSKKKIQSGSKAGLGSERGNKNNREGKNSGFCVDKVVKEEIEDGELGSLKMARGEVENGEFVPEKQRKFEIKSAIEKPGSPVERWGEGEQLEMGEFIPGKRRKDYAGGKGELSSRRSRIDNVPDKIAEFGSWRGGSKYEVEKGEFTFSQGRS